MTVKLGQLVAWAVNSVKNVTGRECSKTEFKRGDGVLAREPVQQAKHTAENQACRPRKGAASVYLGAMQNAYISLINCIN